jgi:diguanylate cyclase (GGDEF)-like protein
MEYGQIDVKEIHWMMNMLQSIDVGLVVLDRDGRVKVWNSFMANHSGRAADGVIGRGLFELFPELPAAWLRRKLDSVRQLKSRAFTTWEQRPYLFRFKNYRPITGAADFMYQNLTFFPLAGLTGEVDDVGLVLYDVTDVALSKKDLEAANAELERLSRTDRLTQLYNRGYWEECLGREFRRVRRTAQPSSLVMFDIDHFKQINDRYGHPAGDEVIRQTARALRECAREADIAGRYGGEEFVVILVGTAADGALAFAERLRGAIAARAVRCEEHEIRYNVSLGVAEAVEAMEEPSQWIECADQALYQAKRGGRNRAVLHRPGAQQRSA